MDGSKGGRHGIGLRPAGHHRQGERRLYECDANIVDISQTVLSGLFNMVLVADILAGLRV